MGTHYFDKRQTIAVHGYIRNNFEKECWLEELIILIVQFYSESGGSLYMFGTGNYGQLGLDKNKNCKKPTLCPTFNLDNTWQVATRNHTLILDINGCVWACGRGNSGCLGIGRKDDVEIPTKLNMSFSVIAVCVGEFHSLLLCDNGWVQSFGSNYYGQLGHGKDSLTPKKIQRLKKFKIVQICAGRCHSAALTAEGDLYCFGDNEYGQCGVGKEKEKKIMIPTKVELDERIAFIDCSYFHSLLIAQNNGMLFSFGKCSYGCLGHGDDDRKYKPVLVDGVKMKKMKVCAAGGGHSICVDEEGIIWSFGRNYEGQCGLPSYIYKQPTPMEIQCFAANNIKAIDCYADEEQSSVISEDGSLYVFGSNAHYQLGLPDSERKKYFVPRKLALPQDLRVQRVSMGPKHTAIICSTK